MCWGSGREEEEEEKGNDIAFSGRDRKGVEVEAERGVCIWAGLAGGWEG